MSPHAAFPSPRLISGLSEIAAGYDVVLCDVWGVIHNGEEGFPEACQALVEFGRTRGPVVLISNAPRPSAHVVPQLAALKVPKEAWSGFVTSGDATREAIMTRTPGPAWVIGPERDAPLYEGTGLEFARRPEDARFVVCTGLYDDENDQPDQYRDGFRVCVERDLEMICANPDRVVQRGDRLVWCAGALAEVYADMGGRVLMAGKPHAPIYATALATAARLLGRPLDARRVLAIGDGIPTDVKGANAQGLDLLFIAAGIHAREAEDASGQIDAARVEALLCNAGAHAAFAMRDLEW